MRTRRNDLEMENDFVRGFFPSLLTLHLALWVGSKSIFVDMRISVCSLCITPCNNRNSVEQNAQMCRIFETLSFASTHFTQTKKNDKIGKLKSLHHQKKIHSIAKNCKPTKKTSNKIAVLQKYRNFIFN